LNSNWLPIHYIKKLENKETVVREKEDRRKDELLLNEIHAASGRKLRISRKEENTKSKEPLRKLKQIHE